jgi:hypothetical protein
MVKRNPERASLRRLRVSTVLALIVVAAAIAVANCSSELVTLDLVVDLIHDQKSQEVAYGWPFSCYWRSYTPRAYQVLESAEYTRPLYGFWRGLRAPSPLSRISIYGFAANAALWVTILGAACVASQRIWPRWQYGRVERPYAITVIVVMIVSALTLLANLSNDAFPERGPTQQRSYGWPFIWCRQIDMATMTAGLREWDFSAVRLAGNAATWLVICAVIGLASQWTSHRDLLRIRWSLRTMLVGIAVVAVLCAWCNELRNRADEQDALIVRLHGDKFVYFEHWGPQWLAVVGANRYRRRIVGAQVRIDNVEDKSQENVSLITQLQRLPALKLLDVHFYRSRGPFVFRPEIPAALGAMRRLKILNVVVTQAHDGDESRIVTDECFAALPKLIRLEKLRVSAPEGDPTHLALLSTLSNLRALRLDIRSFHYRSVGQDVNGATGVAKPCWLASLAVLPRLEILDLHDVQINGGNLNRIAHFPRLKALNLSCSTVSGEDLSQLAPLQSLEEIVIDEGTATAGAFESLMALKRLKAIHVTPSENDDAERSASLALDDGYDVMVVPEQVIRLARALRALHTLNAGITIDGRYRAFDERTNLEPPWLNSIRTLDAFMSQ